MERIQLYIAAILLIILILASAYDIRIAMTTERPAFANCYTNNC